MNSNSNLSPMDDIANMFSVDDYMYFYSDYLSPERSDAETQAVVNLLEMNQPMRVLDLACGFGRIANRLALLGYRVTGVEYQPGFLEIARAAAEAMEILEVRRGGSARYIQGDMRQIEFSAQFERAIMMFNSFGYFSDAENLEVLKRIGQALVPGGRLGFDIGSRDGLMANFHPHYVSEKDGNLMINRFSFDVQSGRLRNERIVIRDGVRKDRPFSIRLYSVSEMRGLLAEAGFTLEQVYGEWDARPLEQASGAMVVIARKI
ncbi:MAG: class I SAM-dependent methyltransferase [Anaerolineaceae bacterium]|nr:class I SAM-dependent methyltransferase [Anaerolineaceae bacterium]